MKGYICDRCKDVQPPQSTQRDEWAPKDWTELTISNVRRHLCDECTHEFGAWLTGGDR